MVHRPCISVVLPAYNAGIYISAAVESILSQSFTDFELLVIDDGSTDNTAEVVNEFSDPRVRLVRNRTNIGLVASLNRGIDESRGRFIARMDGDDLSLPDRLMLELELLTSDPDLGVVSCGYEKFQDSSSILERILLPPIDTEIRRDLYCKSHVFCHAAALIRRKALEGVGGYRREWFPVEDRDLWLRVMEKWKGANVGKVLYKVRKHESSVCSRNSKLQSELVITSTIEALHRRYAPPSVSMQVSKAAWSRGALFAAFGLAMQEQTDRITAYFSEAIQLDQAAARQSFEELLLDRIAIYMHNYDADVTGALALSRRVFATLPSEWADLRLLQPKIEGRIHEIAAFHFANSGEKQRARAEARRALLCSRHCFRNRGLLKLALGLPVS